MQVVEVEIQGLTPYSQSRYYMHEVPELNKESKDAYEKRTWRNKMWFNDKGETYIPPMACKNCITETARHMGEKIKGRGNKTWTKYFERGLMVSDAMMLGVHRDDVKGEWLHVPSDGVRGGGKRVMRCFPVFPKWGGTFKMYVLDDAITHEVIESYLRQAGNFVGLGRFRPERCGYYGRFEVVNTTWSEL